MLQWLCNFIADELFVVTIPRSLVLKNRRLGTFYKLLQLIVFSFLVFYCFISRVFLLRNAVKPWGVTLWPEDTLVDQSGHAQLPHYCDNPEVYAYRHESSVVSYAPTACRALMAGEAYSSRSTSAADSTSSGMFVPTFAADSTFWEGTGGQCGAAAREACMAKNATGPANYHELGNTCSCTLHEHFVVPRAEERRIRLFYGYEVDLSGLARGDVRRGGIIAGTNLHGPQHAMEQSSSDLKTMFWAPDGKPCNFGAMSSWPLSKAAGGISGTLQELLICAGVTLDSNPEVLVAGAALPWSPPHLRTLGLRLELLLDFEESLFGQVVCNIRVVATPVATAVWSTTVQPWGSSIEQALRSRRLHGVSLSTHVGGHIYTFSWFQLVRGFVDVTVVLQIPRFIVYFVSMYLMGLVSDVYRHSARTQINIFSRFHSSVAKLVLAEVAFRSLVGKNDGDGNKMPGLTPSLLHKHLRRIFKEERNKGILQEEELMQMTTVIFSIMDKDGTGEISCNEFTEACSDDGDLTVHRLARFFDDDAKFSNLRWLLDSTHNARKVVQQTAADKAVMQDFFLSASLKRQVSGSRLSISPLSFCESGSFCEPQPLGKTDTETSQEQHEWQQSQQQQQQEEQQPQQQQHEWLASHRILEDAHKELSQRMRTLELYCEDALAALKAAVSLHGRVGGGDGCGSDGGVGGGRGVGGVGGSSTMPVSESICVDGLSAACSSSACSTQQQQPSPDNIRGGTNNQVDTKIGGSSLMPTKVVKANNEDCELQPPPIGPRPSLLPRSALSTGETSAEGYVVPQAPAHAQKVPSSETCTKWHRHKRPEVTCPGQENWLE